jgi:hypothetical protein
MGSAGFYVDLRATVRSQEFTVSVETDRPLSRGVQIRIGNHVSVQTQ